MAEDELKGLDLKKEEIQKDPKKYIEAYAEKMDAAAKISGSSEFNFSEVASKIEQESGHSETIMRVGAAKFKLDEADKLKANNKESGARKLAEEAYEILHPPTPEKESEALKEKASSVLGRLRGYLGDKVKPTRTPTPPPETTAPEETAPAPTTPTGPVAPAAATTPGPTRQEPERNWQEFANFSGENWMHYIKSEGPDKTAFKMAEVAYNLVNIGQADKAKRLVEIARQIKPAPSEEAMEKVERAEAAAEEAPEKAGTHEPPVIITARTQESGIAAVAVESATKLEAAFKTNILLKMSQDEKGNYADNIDNLLKTMSVSSNSEKDVKDMGPDFEKVFRSAVELVEKCIASAKTDREDVKKAVLDWLEKRKDLLNAKAKEGWGMQEIYQKVLGNPKMKPENEDELRIAKLLAAKDAITKIEEIADRI